MLRGVQNEQMSGCATQLATRHHQPNMLWVRMWAAEFQTMSHRHRHACSVAMKAALDTAIFRLRHTVQGDLHPSNIENAWRAIVFHFQSIGLTFNPCGDPWLNSRYGSYAHPRHKILVRGGCLTMFGERGRIRKRQPTPLRRRARRVFAGPRQESRRRWARPPHSRDQSPRRYGRFR